MKTFKLLFISLVSLMVINPSFAQSDSKKEIKKITVAGSAEMEIVPDEIFFTVVLREYLDKDKKKVQIENLEKELQAAASAAGVSKENLQFENVYGERWKEKKGKPEDFLQAKSYIIKLSEPSKIDVILDKLDAKGIDNVYLSDFSHSKIEQFRKELKIQAIKNTKEKAKYLLEAIGEQLGNTLSISEDEGGHYLTPIYNQRMLSNTSQTRMRYNEENGFSDVDAIGFKTIKLRFAITGVFEIK